MRLAGVNPRDPTSQHLLARVDQADAVALVLEFPRNREDSPAALLAQQEREGCSSQITLPCGHPPAPDPEPAPVGGRAAGSPNSRCPACALRDGTHRQCSAPPALPAAPCQSY